MRNDLNLVLWNGDAGAAATQLADDPAFAWIRPIIDTTLSDYIDNYLAENPPDLYRYDPYDIHMNVSVANDMVNRCLGQRLQIYEVEALALQAALAYKRQKELLESDQFQLELDAKAKLKILDLPCDEAMAGRLASRKDAILKEINAKIALHNLRGSPLNYGEQISFTRKVYADNVKTIVERIAAIQSGMQACYELSDGLPPLDADEDQSDNLDKIVWWLRAVVAIIEHFERTQLEGTVYLPAILLASKDREFNEVVSQFLTNGLLEFDVDLGALRQFGLSNVVTVNGRTPLRITGAGVALCVSAPIFQTIGITDDHVRDNQMRDNRVVFCRSLAFKGEIIAPAKGTEINRRLDLGLLPVGINEIDLDQFKIGNAGSLQNVNPLGTWQIWIQPETPVSASFGVGPAPGLGPTNLEYLKNFTLTELQSYIEVILCLSVAHGS